jgi:uncharacterized membrane protein (UPF0127 family)
MRVLVVALLFIVAACNEKPVDSTDERILPFDSAVVRLASTRDTITVHVELALSSEQKTLGLMQRRHLAENAGMLFVYDSTQAPDAGFWMYRTRIPLDIAFIDSAGVVRAILAMAPCESTYLEACPTYPPMVPYRYALEVGLLSEAHFGRRRLPSAS